jgi:hypothetical protein
VTGVVGKRWIRSRLSGLKLRRKFGRLTHDIALHRLAGEIGPHVEYRGGQHRTGHRHSQGGHGGQDDDGPLVGFPISHRVLYVDELGLIAALLPRVRRRSGAGHPVDEERLFPRPRAIVGLFDDPGVRGGLADPRSRFERVVLERTGFRFRW